MCLLSNVNKKTMKEFIQTLKELHINHLKYTGEPYDAPSEDL